VGRDRSAANLIERITFAQEVSRNHLDRMWRLGLVDVEPREVGVAGGAAARVIKAAMARVGVATLVVKKRILDQIDH